jgi:RNA polymerase sigma-70 factor (ECF subfamily)
LFKTCHDRIYRYILRLVRDSAEAEDLTQETFLRAHLRQESLRDPQAVRTWLYRIATHICLDRLRQRARHATVGGEDGSGRLESAASGTPSVLQVAEQKEMSACVQQYLDQLPDDYRAVILLHDLHSLTAGQIADLLGVRVGTIKIRLHRARRKLRGALEAGCAFSQDERGVFVCQPKS